MKTKRKKKVPPEVSAYMSKIGKNGWKAKEKKLLEQSQKVEKQKQ